MNTNRRKFLTSTSALTASAAAGSMLRWGVESAEAQSMGGYKALVCVFLFGGNDSNNMIIPYTDYAAYAAVRTAASNVAISAGAAAAVQRRRARARPTASTRRSRPSRRPTRAASWR